MKINRKNGKPFGMMTGTGALMVGACLAGSMTARADDAKVPPAPDASKPSEAGKPADESDLVNWLEVGVGGNFVKGDKAQFQQQNGIKTGAFGGIESFHYELPVAQKGLFSVDGRGIVDNHDYSVRMELSHPDKGFLKLDYTEFREYYDGTGGYLPSNGLIFQGLFNPALAVDRRHFSVEAGLTLPDLPVVTFRYDMQSRDGTKDSTSWGQTLLGPGGSQKKIVPTYLGLDEDTHLFSLDVKHTIGKTEFGLGGSYELQTVLDSRNVYQQPNQGTTSRVLTQSNGENDDMFSVHAFTDTRVTEHWEFTSGYSFTTLHSALSGSRLDTPITAPLSATDTRFANLAGGSDVNQYVMNASFMNTTFKNWTFVPAVRVEKQDLNGMATDNAVTGNPVQVVSPNTQFASSDEGALYVTESLDVRYVGITNWAFYARTEFSEDQSDLGEQFGANIKLAPTILRNTEWTHLLQKYTIGLNWYPERGLNFGAQYYHKMSDNDYFNHLDSTSNNYLPLPGGSGDRYPAYLGKQNFDVDDVNFRMTWRPLSMLTLVSRYDFQLNTVDTQPIGLPEIQSGINTRHMFGQTVSWTPLNWLYVQANGNYVLDKTDSPVEELSGAVSGVVLSAPNNYWTAGGSVGMALDEKSDLRASYSYYRANDYVNNSLVGMPYGAGARQHEVSATLSRQLTRNLRWSLKYAFSSYSDQTSGGALDYRSNGILSTLQYRF